MPPKYLLFHVWHKGKIFFTPGFIQLVARRQYKPLCGILNERPTSHNNH